MNCTLPHLVLLLTKFLLRRINILMWRESLCGRVGITWVNPLLIIRPVVHIVALLTWQGLRKIVFTCINPVGVPIFAWFIYSRTGPGQSVWDKLRLCMFLHQEMKWNFF